MRSVAQVRCATPQKLLREKPRSIRTGTQSVRPNFTELICFNLFQLQEFVYTSGAELDQLNFNLMHGTVFTRGSIGITGLLVQSSSIRLNLSTTVQGGIIGLKVV